MAVRIGTSVDIVISSPGISTEGSGWVELFGRNPLGNDVTTDERHRLVAMVDRPSMGRQTARTGCRIRDPEHYRGHHSS
ncbi:hypothetical protein AB0J47_27570 [Nocardia sp. NPDC049737]|uniref:hypothetical protein n=1 Tax=Nocardia sp. NPDC049737 TaxID=3154358 RepID=UPI00342FD01F